MNFEVGDLICINLRNSLVIWEHPKCNNNILLSKNVKYYAIFLKQISPATVCVIIGCRIYGFSCPITKVEI